MLKIFKDTDLLENTKIEPLILISLVKLNGYSENSANIDQEKNKIYTDLNLYNTSMDFFDRIGLEEDIDIWEPQFENGNVLSLFRDSKNSFYYLIHISFLTSYHENLIKHELSKYEKINMLNHVEKFVNKEKEILKRNSGRKLFNFCCEHFLNLSKYEEDSKAVEIKNKGKPYMVVFDHYEFLNDFCIKDDNVYYFENCSRFSEKHLKIYTPKKIHFLDFDIEEEEEEITAYRTLNKKTLNRIYGDQLPIQNYKTIIKHDPDDTLLNGETKVKKKDTKVLDLEQIYL